MRTRDKRRTLILVNGSERQTTGLLMAALKDRLQQEQEVKIRYRNYNSGIIPKLPLIFKDALRSFMSIRKNDILIVHSAFSLSFFSILIAWLFRKRIVGFVWDVYPASFGYSRKKYSTTFYRIYSRFETLCYQMCDWLVVPHEGYLSHLDSARNTRVLTVPLWPVSKRLDVRPRETMNSISIGFAGQLAQSRGLERALDDIVKKTSCSVVFHLFSADPLPTEMQALADRHERISIVHHGFIPQDRLTAFLNGLDLGLVSLDPAFNLPAYPSKILSYVCAGIPILYSGPDNPHVEDDIYKFSIGVSLNRIEEIQIATIEHLKENYNLARERFLAYVYARIKKLDSIL